MNIWDPTVHLVQPGETVSCSTRVHQEPVPLAEGQPFLRIDLGEEQIVWCLPCARLGLARIHAPADPLAVPLSVSEIDLFRTLLAAHTAPLKRMPSTLDFEQIKERHRDLSERLTRLYQAHKDDREYVYVVCEPATEQEEDGTS